MSSSKNILLASYLALSIILFLVCLGIMISLVVRKAESISLTAISGFVQVISGLSIVKILDLYKKEMDWDRGREMLDSLVGLRGQIRDDKFEELLDEVFKKRAELLRHRK